MAENIDNPSLNFSIESTMEGMGNTELLEGFLSPETATGDADKLEPIIEETEDKLPKKETKQKGKEVVQKEDGELLSAQDLVSNLLGDDSEEEEEIEEKVSPPIKEAVEEGQEETEVSQWTALARDLFRLDIFRKEEEEGDIEITTPEEFRDRFIEEKRRGAIDIIDNFKGRFGEDYQNAFDAIFIKGVNPREYFNTYNTIVSFAELDLTDEGNQEKVIRQALTDQGFEPEDITTEVDRLKNYGDLETVAAKHHKVLVKKEALKLQEMEQRAEQELQTKAAIKTQYVQNVQHIIEEKLKTKEFDGIPINPKLANELQDFLLVDKYRTASGETITDFDRAILEMKRPENHAMKVKVGLILKILEKDPSLSTIQRSGVTKKSDQLFTEVARQKTTDKTVVGSRNKPNSIWSQSL